MKTILTVLVCIAATVPAAAQETDLPVTSPPRSTAMATGLAVFGTLVPVAMMAASVADDGEGNAGLAWAGCIGSIVGPGLGHAYAGQSGRFWKGAGIRTLAWFILFIGFAEAWNDGSDDEFEAAAYMAMVVYGISAVSDIVRSADSANRYNAQSASRKVTVAPALRLRGEDVGLGVAVGF